MMCGTDGTADRSDVQYAPINAKGSVGTWATTTSLSAGRNYQETAVYNGYLYLIGGYSGGYMNDVQYVKIDPAGTTSTYDFSISFTTARYGHGSVAYNGYLYVLGGMKGAKQESYLNDVQYAPINADGTIGSWAATTSFTAARGYPTAVAYNGYMYVMGGWSGSLRSDVQYAPINANGTIGSWAATTSFPTARWGHTSFTYNGYMYVMGGTDDAVYLNDVQYAPINANGTIGSWAATTSFTTGRSSHTSVTYNGYVYVMGGTDGTNYFSDVQYAPINANGTLGTWQSTTSFATGRYGFTSIAYNGNEYNMGGTNGGAN
jgi:N-acetylneuraminic acid mutarotase